MKKCLQYSDILWILTLMKKRFAFTVWTLKGLIRRTFYRCTHNIIDDATAIRATYWLIKITRRRFNKETFFSADSINTSLKFSFGAIQKFSRTTIHIFCAFSTQTKIRVFGIGTTLKGLAFQIIIGANGGLGLKSVWASQRSIFTASWIYENFFFENKRLENQKNNCLHLNY